MTTYAYDANGNQTKVTDAADGVSVYTYDKFNRVTSATAPDGSVESTSYDAAGNVVAVTDPTGAKTTYGYDKTNRLVSKTSPRGNAAGADPAKYTTTYGYDSDGNQTTTVDPTGAVTATRYDTLNRPVQVTDALSHTTKTTYDGNGNVATITDGRGKVTAYTYTPADLLETVTDPLGKVTTFGYDADGNRTSSTTPLGRKHTWTYDADGRLKSETDPRGNVSGADPAGYTTTYGYDLDGNQTTVTDPLGNTQSEQYDPVGRLTLSEDAAHHKTLIDYDALGRVKTVTAADGGVTSYTYDQAGNVHTRVDDDKRTTTYSYDAAHHLNSVTDPLGHTVKYSYDQDGNQQKATNARGVTATTAFDARGLPTGISYTDDTPSTTTTYDAVGNRKTVTDATGTRTFTYDENNQVVGITAPGKTTGFSYTYDDAGHITSRTYPDGRATTYTYTSDGNRDSSTTDGIKTTYGYNASAQLTRTTLPSTNGYVETRAYDAAGRLTDISSAKGAATLTSTHAEYDASGQPERIDDVRGTTATSHYYSYDATGRLLTDCASSAKADTCPSGAPTTAFTYDKVGNRLTQTEDGKTTTYSYNDVDELTKTTTGSSTTAYDYDADGNQTAAGTNKFTYDAVNRLTSATVGSVTYGYTYDADDNRVAASKNGSALRTMTWDLNNELPLLATENGTTGSLIADYQYNPVDQIQGETTGAGTFYHHHDLLGSVTDITDAQGALQRSYDYTAFGEVTQTDVATSPPTNRFTYTGEYKEPTTNAAGYYLRARNYDPDTGRLTTRDPYAPSEDTPYTQPYAYVENAPTSRTDPSGMCSVTTQLKDVFTGNWGWNNNCAKEDRETATKPPVVQAAKNLSDTTTRALINGSGQASLGFLDGLTFGTFSHFSGAQVTCPQAYNAGLYAGMVSFPLDWEGDAASGAVTAARGRIPYGQGLLARAVQFQRLLEKNKRSNYAAALLKSGDVIVAHADNVLHAEEKLLNTAGEDIVAVYSERQPCNGSHNCEAKLLKAGVEYVSWSFDWNTSKAVQDKANADLKAAIRALFG